MKQILEDQGIVLATEGDNYYLIYDSGEIMIKMKRIKITTNEAQAVISNPDVAYNIIISYQDNGDFGENF